MTDDESHTDDERAAWMLKLVDDGPHRLANLTIPCPGDLEDLAEVGRMIERTAHALILAKRQRPDLAVTLLPPDDPAVTLSVDAAWPLLLVVQIHEHEWVGGACIRGCGERSVDGEPPEA